VLGDYATTVPSTMFMQTKQGRPSADRPDPSILDMRHRRIVFSSEPEGVEHRLNETFIKQVSGNDRVSARYLYGNVQQKFRFATVVALLTNQVLEVEDSDPAMRQRTIILPFEQEFRGTDREDPDLLHELKREAEGILSLFIRTAVAYRQRRWGKTPLRTSMPRRTKTATEAYFDKNNVLGSWKTERVITDLGGLTSTQELFTDYEAWFRVRGHAHGLLLADKVTYPTFIRRAGQLGLAKKDTMHAKGYVCRLREDEPGQPDQSVPTTEGEPGSDHVSVIAEHETAPL